MALSKRDGIRMLRRARGEGPSSHTLTRDEAFAPLRDHHDFQRELDQSRRVERDARRALERTGVAFVRSVRLAGPSRPLLFGPHL